MDQVQNPNSWYKICPGCPEYGRVHWSVMEGYGQFCPVAMTAELLTRRWTPLVIRELLEGSHRFNEIRRGVPRMSPSLLVQRLRELEKGGVLVRRPVADGDHSEYHLTPAGEELAPIIMQMGAWGRRWAQSEISRRHLDAGLLMWNIHRKVRTERLPARQVVVRFHFREAPKGERDFWLVLHGREVDLCLVDPGHEVDLWVEADLLALTQVWLGDLRFVEAVRCGAVELTGPVGLRRALPGWFGLQDSANRKRVAAR